MILTGWSFLFSFYNRENNTEKHISVKASTKVAHYDGSFVIVTVQNNLRSEPEQTWDGLSLLG